MWDETEAAVVGDGFILAVNGWDAQYNDLPRIQARGMGQGVVRFIGLNVPMASHSVGCPEHKNCEGGSYGSPQTTATTTTRSCGGGRRNARMVTLVVSSNT